MSEEADAFIGLGSNLGDRERHVETAIREIAALPGTTLLSRSSLYESAPVDAGGGDYLNAVARVRTSLGPTELLAALQAIEASHGRERPYRNAPRSLDLDLLLHGDAQRATPELTLPHPRLHERAFVLLPLIEIAPGLRIAGRGGLAELLRDLGDQHVATWRTP
jgi:2-amino-4-hydroxy-6-hydroxymethyldihydropteridine diphosphokinase